MKLSLNGPKVEFHLAIEWKPYNVFNKIVNSTEFRFPRFTQVNPFTMIEFPKIGHGIPYPKLVFFLVRSNANFAQGCQCLI